MMSIRDLDNLCLRDILLEEFDTLPGPGILSCFHVIQDLSFLFVCHPLIGNGIDAFEKGEKGQGWAFIFESSST